MNAHNKKNLTGNESILSQDEIIVTKTDSIGKIRYGNRTFFKYSGYSYSECIGFQHNIVRHPEMPRTIFKLLWDSISAGNEIFAYVNNRAKNGDHYWVLAHVTPSIDTSGQLLGYHSNRRAPSQHTLREHIEPLYKNLLHAERSASSPKEGLVAGMTILSQVIGCDPSAYNEYIFSLGV